MTPEPGQLDPYRPSHERTAANSGGELWQHLRCLLLAVPPLAVLGTQGLAAIIYSLDPAQSWCILLVLGSWVVGNICALVIAEVISKNLMHRFVIGFVECLLVVFTVATFAPMLLDMMRFSWR